MLCDDLHLGTYTDVQPSKINSEAAGIRSNGVYTAFPWQIESGGKMKVFNSFKIPENDEYKFSVNGPFLYGHSAQIIDFGFSPFADNLLCTGAEDGQVKLWVLPEEITSDIKECDGTLSGHTKKLSFVRFNPTANYALATAACDNTVKIWDVQRQENVLTYDDIQGNISGMHWNTNGSQIITVSKDKKMRVFDPRSVGAA
jgi:WD40 repeat protein